MKHWGKDILLTRRGMIAGAAGLLVARTAEAALMPTPRQATGPFYPRVKPADSDTDLTTIAGGPAQAQGLVIDVLGRIMSVRGQAIEGAVVEIWQADANGRYHHPLDTNIEARDRNFQGYGVVRAAGDGAYRFRTIKPKHYNVGNGFRTPHIHFRVVLPKQRREFVTQMYFPSEDLNASDWLYQNLPSDAARAAVTARAKLASIPQYRFDVVL